MSVLSNRATMDDPHAPLVAPALRAVRVVLLVLCYLALLFTAFFSVFGALDLLPKAPPAAMACIVCAALAVALAVLATLRRLVLAGAAALVCAAGTSLALTPESHSTWAPGLDFYVAFTVLAPAILGAILAVLAARVGRPRRVAEQPDALHD
jgi:hypothetical protein